MIMFFKAKILSAVAFFGSFLCHQRNEHLHFYTYFSFMSKKSNKRTLPPDTNFSLSIIKPYL
jgi:hypothetical protein